MTVADMTVASMTGFARREGGDATMTWTWEAKSVNARGLDVRTRLPNGLERLETAVRTAVPRYCARGNVSVNLTVDRGAGMATLQVNRPLLNDLLALSRELANEESVDPPRLDGLLAVRGVIEVAEARDSSAVRTAREAQMGEDLEALLAALAEGRRGEGARLKDLALGHLDEIARLTGAARATADAQPEALRARLHRQVTELLTASQALPEDRLVQEAALLASKADVREELDRLDAHDAAARELLAEGGAIGRRLDFLCQEFNREANTLCSKTQDVALTRIGLALKNTVEQLREQIQNIE